jgi:hypothetical protein
VKTNNKHAQATARWPPNPLLWHVLESANERDVELAVMATQPACFGQPVSEARRRDILNPFRYCEPLNTPRVGDGLRLWDLVMDRIPLMLAVTVADELAVSSALPVGSGLNVP